ncbi:MAG: hypothetical protein FVQ78_09430 [Solirubrobacterales bacterium]|nr:hypothetical protein [Solirubrobacterales bacterium]
MSSDLRQTTGNRDGRPPRARPTLLALCALALALLLGAAMPVPAIPSGAAEAGRLHSALVRMTKLANRQVRPPALRLARDLPGDAKRLNALREPASTAQTQMSVVLDELQQMNALILDPHYLPALVAAGRAFMAVSGQDPLTRTTINPDYLGLEPELAVNAERLRGAAGDAGKLSAGVKRLTRALIRSKRRARRLEREIRRLRARGAAPQRR